MIGTALDNIASRWPQHAEYINTNRADLAPLMAGTALTAGAVLGQAAVGGTAINHGLIVGAMGTVAAHAKSGVLRCAAVPVLLAGMYLSGGRKALLPLAGVSIAAAALGEHHIVPFLNRAIEPIVPYAEKIGLSPGKIKAIATIMTAAASASYAYGSTARGAAFTAATAGASASMFLAGMRLGSY